MMDLRGSYLGKRSLSEAELINQQKSDKEDVPVKKKLRTKLVDLFNRASVCLAVPDDYIQVHLRIKPFTPNEDASQKCFFIAKEENTIVATAPEASHAFRNMKRGLGSSSHTFTFSKIFHENTSQGDFFNATMLGMTKDFISGQNSLVFTYGVTSSGKTYTIQGQPQNAGILPRCLDVIFNSINGKQIPSSTPLKPHMFTDVVKLSPSEVAQEKKIKERTLKMSIEDDTTVMTLLGDEMESALSDTATSGSSACGDNLLADVENRDRENLKVDVEDQGKIRFGIWVSFVEIYNEQLFDLLEPFPHKKNTKRPILKICDDRNGNPYVKGLKWIHVESADEAYRLLTIGQRNLRTACTRLNHCSSRSHCIFNIKIVRVADKDDPHIARVSMLSLCDLAGSERYSKTQATGERLKEAGNINSSLMTLGRCIETLRHNQLHRDQQRLVPFRDSKLTRLLQNYFNGSGRAVMIVNVSQSASMFDDTLHVFKFSAIAKQVKYIEKPPEPPKKAKEKKVAPSAQRPSIEWEVQVPTENTLLKDAVNNPLPVEDEDEELHESGDEEHNNIIETFNDIHEMAVYIKELRRRNERLYEMLEEEMTASSNLESRVRKEVTEAMMKQVVNIEETYSAMLKETAEDAQESAEERIKVIISVYEQRLERIQRKVDEDDEWVSSLLYHQAKVQIEERDAEIAGMKKQIEDLQKEITESKSTNDSVDIGNSVLIETLTQKLQEANDVCKEKDLKIEELESLISEAGEVYNKHLDEISELTQQNKKFESQLSSMQGLESQLKETTASCEALEQALRNKEAEWRDLEEKLNRKIENKDSTISTLQDECKELHDEIERLQDQMSQMDEQSKYCNDLEISTYSEHASKRSSKDSGRSSKIVLEQIICAETVKENQSKQELSHVREVARKVKEADKSNTSVEFTEFIETDALQKTTSQLTADLEYAKHGGGEEIASLNEVNHHMKNELENLKSVNEELTMKVLNLEKQLKEKKNVDHSSKEDVSNTAVVEHGKQSSSFTKKDKTAVLDPGVISDSDDNEIAFNTKITVSTQESLKQESQKLRTENFALQKANEEIKATIQTLEDQLINRVSVEHSESKSVNIADMVRQIEQKVAPVSKSNVSGKCDSSMDKSSGDDEVVFNQKIIPTSTCKALISAKVTPKTPSAGKSFSGGSSDLTVKLKDAELANAALRNKLKKDEEDYFEREQALIHGYTAEIEHLKYELAKLKSKVDGPGRTLRSKVKAVDPNVSSSVSDSINEISMLCDSKLIILKYERDDAMEKLILSNELLSIQEELLSLNAAFRKLQAIGKRNRTNSFIQNVVLGTPGSRRSTMGVFKAEDTVADSVLQFELDEYAVKLDEMKIRLSQQDDEIKISKTAFEKLKAEKSVLENQLKEMLQRQEAQQSEMSDLVDAQRKDKTLKNMTKEMLQEKDCAYTQLFSEVQEQQAMITQLRETLESEIFAKNDAEQKLVDLTEQLMTCKDEYEKMMTDLSKVRENAEATKKEQDKILQIAKNFFENQNLPDCRAEGFELGLVKLQDLMKQKECELKLSKEDFSKLEKLLQESERKFVDVVAEKTMLEETIRSKHEELSASKEKVSVIEQKYNHIKETLEKTISSKVDVENKLKNANEILAEKVETLMKQKQEFDIKESALKQQLSGEGEAKLVTITKLEMSVDCLQTQLKQKTAEIEKLECKRQEEAAEVSQKLLMLEREKKLAERKAADAKERELEWQMKCQGLDHMKELEQQLHQQLRTAAETVRKHSKKTRELIEEVTLKNKELDHMREELTNLKLSNTKIDDLRCKISEVEQSLTSEREQKLEVQKRLEEYQEMISLLKNNLEESEETMKKQDIVMSKQDEDLEEMENVIKERGLEISHLKDKISKLETEIADSQKIQRKTLDVEQICHEQLQNSQAEFNKLEERLQQLETENRHLEEMLKISEEQIQKDRKDFEILDKKLNGTLEQKKELEIEMKQMTEKRKMLEDEMEKVNQQRVIELELSRLLDTELKHLKKKAEEGTFEKNKVNEDLEKENKKLNEELDKLKKEILSKQREFDKLHDTLEESTEHLKSQEKELHKQDSINKRNREEMENWKQERDSCVNKLEQLIHSRQQENKQLVHEIEQLKKDNTDLAKSVNTVTSKKDSVIAELRKVNNTLSIQLAQAQGMPPPPKITTPDSSVLHRLELTDDLDTTGHLEIDATPPIAAKKGRKRHGSSRQLHTSPVGIDNEIYSTPICKSLKPIEEQNESSPGLRTHNGSPTKNSFHGRVAVIASDVIASISPLTRSAKRQEKESKKKQTSSILGPFDLASYVAPTDTQNENANPLSPRRSSRLRTKIRH